MHARLILLSLLLLCASALAADPPLADAVECRPRAGLPNVAKKLETAGDVRVAYIGGSITAANGWRPKTTTMLQKMYPKARVIEIHAAIGGTGSDLGVFRFGQDVMAHKPDLIFVEFAVNDGGAPVDQIIRCMEGMVRQAWKQNAAIDICFVYTLTAGMAPQLQEGKFPRSATAMDIVADHYQIPTLHMGLEVVRLAKEGKLILQANPKTDEEKAALKDKIIFSGDGVHPHEATGHEMYRQAIERSWPKLAGAKDGAHAMPAPLRPDNYEGAAMLPLDRATLSNGFTKLDPAKDGRARSFARFMPEMYQAAPGQTLTLKFKGTAIGFFDLLGPDCGALEVSVDGKPASKVLRFDSYATYHRMGSFFPARDLPPGEHTVTIKVLDEKIDKAGILAKRNEKMNDPKRFEETNWYVSRIMIVE